MGEGCRVDICQHTEMGTALGVLYVGLGDLGVLQTTWDCFQKLPREKASLGCAWELGVH